MIERIKKKVLVKGTPLSYSSEFAITITLKPSMYAMEAVMQRNAIQGIINSMQNCKMSLICELTQAYNIHLHGTIKVPLSGKKDVQHIVHNMFRPFREIGFICVKQIDNYEHWQLYCLKDYKKTIDNIIEKPVIRDDNDFFPLHMIHKLEYEGDDEKIDFVGGSAKSEDQ